MKAKKEIMNSLGRNLLEFYFPGPRDMLDDANEVIDLGIEGVAVRIKEWTGDAPDEIGILSPEQEASLILEFALDYKVLRSRRERMT